MAESTLEQSFRKAAPKNPILTCPNGRKAQSFRLESGVYRICTMDNPPRQIGYVMAKAPAKKGDPPQYGYMRQLHGDESLDPADYIGAAPRLAIAVQGLLTANDRATK